VKQEVRVTLFDLGWEGRYVSVTQIFCHSAYGHLQSTNDGKRAMSTDLGIAINPSK